MYKFVRNFKQNTTNKSFDDASSSSITNVNNTTANKNEASVVSIQTTNVPATSSQQQANDITLSTQINRTSFTKIKNTQPNKSKQFFIIIICNINFISLSKTNNNIDEFEIIKSIKSINETLIKEPILRTTSINNVSLFC